MSKILYFDCFSGISGDMTLGALLNLGIDFNNFKFELAKLGLENEYTLELGQTSVNGISAFDLTVNVNEHHHNHHEEHHSHGRNFADICHIINSSALNEQVKEMSKKIFTVLANAEAKVHNKPVDEVHFHEVGAVDSIVDIIGTAICIDILNPDKIICSHINEGTGFVKCQHGTIPVPVPATLEIMRSCKIPYNITDEIGEMVTPTGISIVATLASEFGSAPTSTPLAIGYGAGKKRFKRPNLLRAMLLEASNDLFKEQVEVIECNIDDSTPEALGFALEAIFSANALDAFFTPIYMKKNRPAFMLTVICELDNVARIEDVIFKNTSTLGIRKHITKRTMLKREITGIETKYGKIAIKVSEYKGNKRYAPEYEDVRAIALKNGIPFIEVYNEALTVCNTNWL